MEGKKENNLKSISLIGMSGIGKTYWAEKLARAGFTYFGCDEEVEKMLLPELEKYGYQGIAEVAKWLGQPYEKTYQERAERYLACEEEVMKKALEKLEENREKKLVIDTTGSVVYLNKEILGKLRKLTYVIYLASSDEVKGKMFAQYLKEPKPVIWGKSFCPKNGESVNQALIRCYPKLVAWREKLYEKYADITLSYQLVRHKKIKIPIIVNAILQH